MGINKRGQFFLLAAVIISVIVISLGMTSNRAIVQSEPGNFYDFTYEVKREVGAVLNYEVYTDVEGGELETFVELMAEDIKDKSPDTEFVFVYGNNDGMTITNYGEEEVAYYTGTLETAIYCLYDHRNAIIVRDVTLEYCILNDPGCYACASECPNPLTTETCSSIESLGGSGEISFDCTYTTGTRICVPIEASSYDESIGTIYLDADDLGDEEQVTITVDGADVTIPLSEYEQVTLIMKKDVGNESFLTVE